MKLKRKKPLSKQNCPCTSGALYASCCQPYHLGEPAPTAEALMRSRYAAFALGKIDYIMATTDPAGPQFRRDSARWRANLAAFVRGRQFVGLEILGTEVGASPDEGRVTFRAGMLQDGRDVSFTERSLFRLLGGRWHYVSGQML